MVESQAMLDPSLLAPEKPRRLKRSEFMERVQIDYVAVEESEPVPDIAIVPLGKYRDAHPDRAHCIMEVANTSVRKDRLVKVPLYAASNVEEYWIVNVVEACVEVFRDSDGKKYQTETRHGMSETVSLLAFPDVSIAVRDVLG